MKQQQIFEKALRGAKSSLGLYGHWIICKKCKEPFPKNPIHREFCQNCIRDKNI